MSYPFSNSSIWLIGASTGIGRSLALKIAPEAKHLFISSRSETGLHSLQEETDPERVTPVPCDVRDIGSLTAAYEKICSVSSIDCLIFNAGIYNPTNVLSFDLEDYLSHFDVNLNGALRALHLVLPDFIAQERGHIAVVSSVAGYRALPNAAAYGASKAALSYFMESLRMSVQEKNIKITIINPGFVQTRLTDKNSFEMPFIISPEEAAEAIYQGMKQGRSEIHFPKKFSYILKILGLLPEPVYRFLVMKLLRHQ